METPDVGNWRICNSRDFERFGSSEIMRILVICRQSRRFKCGTSPISEPAAKGGIHHDHTRAKRTDLAGEDPVAPG